jgi:hypothetical protein
LSFFFSFFLLALFVRCGVFYLLRFLFFVCGNGGGAFAIMLLRSMGCYPRDLLPKTVFTTPELNRSEVILRSITIDVLNVRSEQTGRRDVQFTIIYSKESQAENDVH